MRKDYWEKITELKNKQTRKGLSKYGQVLEDNDLLSPVERIVYLEEELVDALMYLEHMKNDNYKGMDANDYQKAALRTAGSTEKDDLILNGILGLCGEIGEVADHIKKFKFQGHDLDNEYLAKEVGDICWYIAILSEGIGYDLVTIMKMNIDKLKKRYPDGFDKERSIHRKDED